MCDEIKEITEENSAFPEVGASQPTDSYSEVVKKELETDTVADRCWDDPVDESQYEKVEAPCDPVPMPSQPFQYQPYQATQPSQNFPYQAQQPVQPMQGFPYQAQQPAQPAQNFPYQAQQPAQPAQNFPYQAQQPAQPSQNFPYQAQQPVQPMQSFPYQAQQPTMPPYPYNQNVAQVPNKNSLAVVGLVLGCIGLVLTFFPVVNIGLSMASLLIGVICCASGRKNGASIASVIVGSIALFLALISTIFEVGAVLSEDWDDVVDDDRPGIYEEDERDFDDIIDSYFT